MHPLEQLEERWSRDAQEMLWKCSGEAQISNMVESFDGYGVAEVFDIWQKCKPQETEAELQHNKDGQTSYGL